MKDHWLYVIEEGINTPPTSWSFVSIHRTLEGAKAICEADEESEGGFITWEFIDSDLMPHHLGIGSTGVHVRVTLQQVYDTVIYPEHAAKNIQFFKEML